MRFRTSPCEGSLGRRLRAGRCIGQPQAFHTIQSIFCAYTILHQVGKADLFGVVIHLHVYYTEGIQMHRGYDYTEDSTGEHYYRDVKLLTVGVDTSASQRQVIPRRLLGTYRL